DWYIGDEPPFGRFTMAVKLHRCANIWLKNDGDTCWRVQKAVDDQGIAYEIVKEPYFGKRENVVRLSGQRKYPVIEFEDGSIYREESKDMAARIRAGKLRERRTGGESPATPPAG